MARIYYVFANNVLRDKFTPFNAFKEAKRLTNKQINEDTAKGIVSKATIADFICPTIEEVNAQTLDVLKNSLIIP
jgi:hypothetical protein